MNNNQFRKLVLDTPARQDDGTSGTRPGATPSAFGAKRSSFMPMTPRNVKGGADVSFAQQVRERNAALRPTKKFKSSAPKGAKFGAGYTDRAKAREDNGDEGGGEANSKGARIKALEEQMKLGQISAEMFEALRDQITGGDISATHLVKGLDRQLLDRVRRGEDVLGTGGGNGDGASPGPDMDEELDKLGEKDVEAIKREKAEKRGTMAPPPSIAGVKRSRDDIMAELKTQRKAAAEAKQKSVALDTRWRKVGEKEKSRIEIDHKGREVLITVDEDGVVKKKVRKVPAQSDETKNRAAEMPDESRPVLGADIAVPVRTPVADTEAKDEDDDIFAGVGTEYNPLGDDVDDDDDDDDDNSDEDDAQIQKDEAGAPSTRHKANIETAQEHDAPEPGEVEEHLPSAKPASRNYFSDPKTTAEDAKPEDRYAGIESVLAKAARLDPLRSGGANDEGDEESEQAREARLKKRAQMLAQQDRDLDDMDMGFGSSRYEDEEEGGEEGKKLKLSEWKGDAGGDEDGADEDGGKGAGKRKRKPKKRKGDVNNAADIMRVIEGRKSGK